MVLLHYRVTPGLAERPAASNEQPAAAPGPTVAPAELELTCPEATAEAAVAA